MEGYKKPCPFCKKTPVVRETFGQLVMGCVNKKCKINPCTWLVGGKIYDVRKLIEFWNNSIKEKQEGA